VASKFEGRIEAQSAILDPSEAMNVLNERCHAAEPGDKPKITTHGFCMGAALKRLYFIEDNPRLEKSDRVGNEPARSYP